MTERVFTAVPYFPERADVWNRFVRECRNRHFMFDRSYMEYHADRFVDCSLFLESDGELVGLIPANRQGDAVWSHQGLSYGGLLTRPSARHADVDGCIRAAAVHWSGQGAARLRYKTVPAIFHRYPSDEDVFVLFARGARLVRRDLFTIVPLRNRMAYSKGRKYALSLSRRNGVSVEDSVDFAGFHDLLVRRLDEKYGSRPTHSAEEMALLASRFPDNIRLLVARSQGGLQAGALLFIEGPVIHTQYLTSTEEGRESGALDAVIDHVVRTAPDGATHLSFGHSNTGDGGVNAGLLFQKEGFGGRALVHDHYEADLSALSSPVPARGLN